MRWMLVGLIVLTGCFRTLNAPARGEPRDVYGVRTVGQQREFDRFAKQTAAWDLDAGKTTGAIGARSGFSQQARVAPRPVARAATVIAAPDPGMRRDVQVLAARVDRLERMVSSTAPAARPAAPPPVPGKQLEIYEVSSDGRTAWVSSGSSKGMKQGLTFEVHRDGNVVGQLKVARVWPAVSELTVLWSNGAVVRGDKAHEVAGGAPAR